MVADDWLGDSENAANEPNVGEKPTQAVSAALVQVSQAKIERPTSERDARLMRMRDAEENILEKSLETMGDALAWNEYSMDELKPETIESLTEEEKRRRRTAYAANLPAGAAPVGLKLASQFIAGVMKARSAATAPGNSGGPLVVINLPAPVSKDIAEGRREYETIDVE